MSLFDWFWPKPIRPLHEQVAEELVLKAETLGVSKGEYKRHWVHARLVKQFPEIRKRDLSMAIEKAVQEVKED